MSSSPRGLPGSLLPVAVEAKSVPSAFLSYESVTVLAM